MGSKSQNISESLTLIDKAVAWFSPRLGLKRMQNRFALKTATELTRRYDAAGKGRRTDNWKAPSSSANSEIHQALATLRNRSRDMVRNNPYAEGAVSKLSNNIIGTGIVPTPLIESKPQLKKLKKLWKDWAEKITCDFDGHLNYFGIQNLVMRTVIESGECIIRRRFVNDKNLPIPMQLQVLEGDFIDTFKHGPVAGGGQILYGVEFDKDMKIVAYWLYENHPGDSYMMNFNTNSNRYPVDTVVHIFEKKRPGQFRGVPTGHASMLKLRDLDEYEDAQLIRQKIAACFSAFVTDNNLTNPLGNSADDSGLTEMVEPGIIQHLRPGQSITFGSPPPAEGYDEFTKNNLRGIATGYGMDYLTFTGDYSAVNFSSGRMSWLDFHRKIAEWQWKVFIPMFCEKTWHWFSQMSAIMGFTRAGLDIDVRWTTPRREMINPETENKAIVQAYQDGLTSWSDAILEAGFDPEEQLAKMKTDKENFQKAGLPVYTEPAKKAGPANNDQQQQQQNSN